MASSSPNAPATPPNGATSFTSQLRFEVFDEDERALLGSYAIATSIGVAFLLLIQFGPHLPIVQQVERTFGPVIVGPLSDPIGKSTPMDPTDGRAGGGAIGARERLARVSGSIRNAFAATAGTGTVGQPTNILGGVVVSRPGPLDAGSGGKTVLEHGEGGMGSIQPGRGGISASGDGGSEIGNVRGGVGVSRTPAKVSMPIAIPIDPLTPAGDAASVGTFVRSHDAALRFCYEEHGLRANPGLGGAVTVAITVAPSGSVSGAAVTKRTWSGPGAAEAEACILRAIRGWRLPSSGAAPTTFDLPFNFSR